MQVGDLYLARLRLVEALSRHANLTDAAKELGLTQPAASHVLSRLRRDLQDPLFVRTSGGMRPTPFGTRLASAVRDALQVLRDGLRQHQSFEPGTAKRTFNIFMSDVGQFLYLPPLLARLGNEGQGISLRVCTLPEKAPHLLLEAGEVDLAIGTFTSLVSGCMQKLVFQDRYVCVVRKNHPAFNEGMSPQAFATAPYAVAEASGYVHEQLDRWLARHKIPRNVKLQVPHFLVLPLVVARSDLIAIMAGRMANVFAPIVPLKIMPPPLKLPTYNVKLFWHERYHRDPASKWLREFVFSTLTA